MPHLAGSEGAALSSASMIQEGEDKEENNPNADAAEDIVQGNKEEEKKERSAPPEKAKMLPAAPASRPVLSNLIDR